MTGPGPALRFVGSHVKGTADPGSIEPKVWRHQRMPMVDGLDSPARMPRPTPAVDGTMQFTITRCLIRQCRHGIHLVNRNRNVLISDCHIYDNRGIGIFYDNLSLHQSNIVGSHISYCLGGGIVFRGGDVRNVHIGTCDIESNHDPKGPATANILIDCSAAPTARPKFRSRAARSSTPKVPTRPTSVFSGAATKVRTPANSGATSPSPATSSPDVMCNVHLAGCRDVTLTGNTF
jgi:hypothetical protein